MDIDFVRIDQPLVNQPEDQRRKLNRETLRVDRVADRALTNPFAHPPLGIPAIEDARECAAEGCDVYLMWPDTIPNVREIIADMTARAAKFGRTLKFGYRVHVVVRETEDEARAYADRLLSKLDDDIGRQIREKSLDARNFGVQRQQALRGAADGDGRVMRRARRQSAAA